MSRGRSCRSTPPTTSQELLIVDPEQRTVSWLALEAGNYQHVKRSRLIELGADELAGQIDWP